MIDAPRLRLATKKLSGRLSVPVLLHGDLALTDGLEIVRYADRVATTGSPLFPKGKDGQVHRVWWLAREVMTAGRVRSLHRALRDREALTGYLPFQAPPWLGPRLSFISEVGVRHILRKYPTADDATTLEANMAQALDELRELLGARTFFIGDAPTAADLAAAGALQFVSPMKARTLPMNPASARAWTETGLSAAFTDLLAWRDAFIDHCERVVYSR